MLYLNFTLAYNTATKDTNLTLTSVVFEYKHQRKWKTQTYRFNFNKCCIWMGKADSAANADLANLTLTSVVFEWNK